MTLVTLDMPESAFATLHQAPAEFVQEMRVAAAVKWYELERTQEFVTTSRKLNHQFDIRWPSPT